MGFEDYKIITLSKYAPESWEDVCKYIWFSLSISWWYRTLIGFLNSFAGMHGSGNARKEKAFCCKRLELSAEQFLTIKNVERPYWLVLAEARTDESGCYCLIGTAPLVVTNKWYWSMSVNFYVNSIWFQVYYVATTSLQNIEKLLIFDVYHLLFLFRFEKRRVIFHNLWVSQALRIYIYIYIYMNLASF